MKGGKYAVTSDDIKLKIEKALNILGERDGDLLEIKINERTLCHRLAIYLEEIFIGYNVDCEYNRVGSHDPKRLIYGKVGKIFKKSGVKGQGIADIDARTVYPDIIVHKRREEENLLVIEVKKDTNKTDKSVDIDILKKYKQELKYEYAVFLLIKVKEPPNKDEKFYDLEFI